MFFLNIYTTFCITQYLLTLVLYRVARNAVTQCVFGCCVSVSQSRVTGPVRLVVALQADHGRPCLRLASPLQYGPRWHAASVSTHVPNPSQGHCALRTPYIPTTIIAPLHRSLFIYISLDGESLYFEALAALYFYIFVDNTIYSRGYYKLSKYCD